MFLIRIGLFFTLACCIVTAQKPKPTKAAGFTKSPNSNRKGFNGIGPYSFDYLLGEDIYKETKAQVLFVDYEVGQSVIQKYKDLGKMVICYVNVGAWEDWRPDADDFPESTLGNDYSGWPGEKWLDIRRLDALLPIMIKRFQTAASKGCEGIDPDNMNGYSVDTGFPLSYDDQINYNIAIAKEIRKLNMLAGLKNDNDQAGDLVSEMDFAVLEQCAAYDECTTFDTFVKNNKPVFAVEYTDAYNENSFRDEVCPQVAQTGMSFILKKYDLKGDFIVSCL